MSTISKHPKDANLAAPASVAVRTAIIMLASGNPVAFAGAIVGVCWRGVGRPSTRWDPKDPASYGMAVFDELCGREGVSPADVFEASARASELIMQMSDPSADEVNEHLGNSSTGQPQGSS